MEVGRRMGQVMGRVMDRRILTTAGSLQRLLTPDHGVLNRWQGRRFSPAQKLMECPTIRRQSVRRQHW